MKHNLYCFCIFPHKNIFVKELTVDEAFVEVIIFALKLFLAVFSLLERSRFLLKIIQRTAYRLLIVPLP